MLQGGSNWVDGKMMLKICPWPRWSFGQSGTTTSSPPFTKRNSVTSTQCLQTITSSASLVLKRNSCLVLTRSYYIGLLLFSPEASTYLNSCSTNLPIDVANADFFPCLLIIIIPFPLWQVNAWKLCWRLCPLGLPFTLESIRLATPGKTCVTCNFQKKKKKKKKAHLHPA